jgi:hypothetical protein
LGTGEEEGDLRNLISKYQNEITINDAILAQAERDVPYDPQYRNNTHLYFDPEVPDKPVIGFDFGASDGQPPNGLNIVGSGTSFPPTGVSDGDYFLRTDFTPNRLFQKSSNRWIRVGDDARSAWAAANRLLTSFINNDNFTINTGGEVTSEKTNLSKVVKPKTDN